MTNKKSGMRAAEERLDFFTAHTLLTYDPITGLFYRKKPTLRQKAGQQTGARASHGYINIHIKGYGMLYAHRLAFLMMTGSWPKNIVDHINHDPSDNRWSNLRDVTVAQNNHYTKVRKDNSSGYRNIKKTKSGNYEAVLQYNKIRYRLGTFNALDDAMRVVKDKRKELGIELDDASFSRYPKQQ